MIISSAPNPKRPKICFIGGARYSQPLNATNEKKFRALKALGDIYVIGFALDRKPHHFTQDAHFYLFPQFSMPILRYLEIFVIGPVLTLWLILRHGVCILVAQSPYEGFAAALAKRLAQFARRQVVLVIESHGDFEGSIFLQRRVLLPRIYRFLMRHVARFALNNADLLRGVSNSTKTQLKYWAPGKQVFQFPAWTDIEVFLQAQTNGEERPSQVILYAGVLIPGKGVHHLIGAFASIAEDFPQARLVIVGREENKSYAKRLREQVRRLGIDGRIQFVGEVPQVELAVRMRQACVFVLPSLSEALGRVVVEAMATGRPVVGSDVGGIPEMVEDSITGFLVPPGDETALAERLRWILEHPREAQEMGRRARAFAKRFFSAQAYVHGYKQVFEAACLLLNEQEDHNAPPAI